MQWRNGICIICNFDPFKEGLYKYTFSMQCEEREVPLNDGVKRIFYSTKGKNKDEVPAILVEFLGYLNDSTDTYVEQNSNEKVRKIHERIKILKKNRAVEERYMHYLYVDKIIEEQENALKRVEDELKETESTLKTVESKLEEAENAIREILFEALQEIGQVSSEVRERIEKENNISILKSMHKIAIKSSFVEQFEEQIANL